MKRRDFILTAATGIGAVSVAAYYFLGDIEYDPQLAEPQSLSLIWDDETIKHIGSKYRKDFPSEDSKRSLVKLLEAKPTDVTITSDFKNGNTVIIDGWILSVTEARQCALAAAQHSK